MENTRNYGRLQIRRGLQAIRHSFTTDNGLNVGELFLETDTFSLFIGVNNKPNGVKISTFVPSESADYNELDNIPIINITDDVLSLDAVKTSGVFKIPKNWAGETPDAGKEGALVFVSYNGDDINQLYMSGIDSFQRLSADKGTTWQEWHKFGMYDAPSDGQQYLRQDGQWTIFANDHNRLNNRNLANQHSVDSITGLTDILTVKADVATTYLKTEVDTKLGTKADKTTTYLKTEVDTKLGTKVDKIAGKQLSTENYTTADKTKLAGIDAGAQVNLIEHIFLNTVELKIDNNSVNIDLTQDYYDKSQINSMLSSVFKYKGSVATYNDLPTNPALGDTWNVLDTGDNYAWDGAAWDKLGGIVDLTNYFTKSEITNFLSAKVDKIAGKQLSTENYTTADKTKLAGIDAGAQVNLITSVAGKVGDVTLVKADVELSNVDNTSDVAKPISSATQQALNLKAFDINTFTEATTRVNIQSGERMNVLFGKIKKYFTDLAAVAFSGNYNDLHEHPIAQISAGNINDFKTTGLFKILDTTQFLNLSTKILHDQSLEQPLLIVTDSPGSNKVYQSMVYCNSINYRVFNKLTSKWTQWNWLNYENVVYALGNKINDAPIDNKLYGRLNGTWSEAGSSSIIVEDVLNSVSTVNALSAKQGFVLNSYKADKLNPTLDGQLISSLGSDGEVVAFVGHSRFQMNVSERNIGTQSFIFDRDGARFEQTKSVLINNSQVLVMLDVFDNLESTLKTYPLSANQGRILKGFIDAKADKTELNLKADVATTYLKTEVDTKLGTKADKTTTYLKTEVDTKLGTKVDKIAGKQLSTENYTTADKTKLAGIDSDANKNGNLLVTSYNDALWSAQCLEFDLIDCTGVSNLTLPTFFKPRTIKLRVKNGTIFNNVTIPLVWQTYSGWTDDNYVSLFIDVPGMWKLSNILSYGEVVPANALTDENGNILTDEYGNTIVFE